MPTYYTQSFTYSEEIKKEGIVVRKVEGDTTFYAVQGSHDHGKGIDFTKAAVDWLVANASWPRDKIRLGKYKSGQPKPTGGGKELTWNDKTKKWEK